MDKGSYTFTALEKKYEMFRAPAFEITVGGKTLTSAQYPISNLVVEITAEGGAGGCTFVIDGQYGPEHSRWENDLDKVVKPGAKLVVKGGYVKQKEIFYGYVDDYTLECGEGAPRITVTGIDGLGYLMSCREPLYGGKKDPAKIVEDILGKSVSAGFAKKATVGTLSGYKTPVIHEKVDDYRFLKVLSERYGASLFAVDGELIFDNVLSSNSPILTLGQGMGLLSLTKRVSLAHQVGEVQIWGRDVNQKPIQGSAKNVSAGSGGKSATQIVSAFKKAVVREYSEFVRTQEECTKLAQARLNAIAIGFVSGQGHCVGIPELIPGRYLKIDGLSKVGAGTYFLSKVVHEFSTEGYYTTFDIKGAKDQ